MDVKAPPRVSTILHPWLEPLYHLIYLLTESMLSGAALSGDLFDHGSLDGVGGLKTYESYTQVIPEIYFVLIFTGALFKQFGLIISGTFSALSAPPVMVQEGYG